MSTSYLMEKELILQTLKRRFMGWYNRIIDEWKDAGIITRIAWFFTIVWPLANAVKDGWKMPTYDFYSVLNLLLYFFLVVAIIQNIRTRKERNNALQKIKEEKEISKRDIATVYEASRKAQEESESKSIEWQRKAEEANSQAKDLQNRLNKANANKDQNSSKSKEFERELTLLISPLYAKLTKNDEIINFMTMYEISRIHTYRDSQRPNGDAQRKELEKLEEEIKEIMLQHGPLASDYLYSLIKKFQDLSPGWKQENSFEAKKVLWEIKKITKERQDELRTILRELQITSESDDKALQKKN